jgi:formylglycine-generating enzyme required for sulfatase activity
MRPRLLLAAAALALALVAAQETYPGPSSPAVQPQWLANLTAWRAAQRASVAFNASVYDNYLPWSSSMYVAPQSHIYDRFLFDAATGEWTPDRFLDDLLARYGGVDGVLLWATYPNLGVDERSQFDLLEDLPGGLAGFGAACARMKARGVRVGLPYNPWDTGTTRRNATDAAVLAQLGVALNADFVNGDTMSLMEAPFFYDSLAAGHPLALQPEGGPVLQSLQWSKMGWGYWPAPFIPDVDAWKFIETRHVTQICNRWATDHSTDIQQAVFNGDGFVSWESVWGTWNGLSPRDAEATRRAGALLRFLGQRFTASPDWEPHFVLAPAPAAAGVFASRWPAPAGRAYAHAATAFTLVNRGAADSLAAPTVPAPCDGGGMLYFDLYAGQSVAPQPVAGGGGGGACAVPVRVEAAAFGALLALDARDAPDTALAAFLREMAAMTAAPLASFSAATTYLQQTMTPIAPLPPAAAPPAGTVLVAGAADWRFSVSGTEIEGRTVAGNDVQFPWEALATTSHAPVRLNVSNLYVDVTPVTNAAYAAFLAASSYSPADAHNFLRDWGAPGTRAPPAGWANKPVTWVDLTDARAYCAWAGKRLPHDWEWSFLASNGTAGQAFPWGNAWDASRVPPQQTGTVRPPPPDVGSVPAGDAPSGVKDLFGLVWQWTDEFTDNHTRAGLTRGGSYYTAVGSGWYFPNDRRVTASTHNKLLLMSPSYDRHGAVGFRCVADAPGPLPPPPPEAPPGCADGTCDAFCGNAAVQGCSATLKQAASMRAPRTGAPCGGLLGPCAAPADACGPGWAPCLSDFSTPALSAAGLRAAISADECANGDGGKYLAAMSHANSAWAPPGGSCPAGTSDGDNLCRPTGWGTEAICCGSDCVLAGCANDLFVGKTMIYDDQQEGCGNVLDVMTGVLCCKV